MDNQITLEQVSEARENGHFIWKTLMEGINREIDVLKSYQKNYTETFGEPNEQWAGHISKLEAALDPLNDLAHMELDLAETYCEQQIAAGVDEDEINAALKSISK